MIQPELLIYLFNINIGVIKQQTEGLTHEESLLPFPFRGNCLNWVLGHILVGRDRVLKLLNEPPLLTPEETALYATDAEPITEANSDKALPLERLVKDLETSQERLTESLKRLTLQEMEALSGDRPLGKRLAFLFFHDTYHTGQTEIHRQLAGKNDKVI
jgi:uncharacterized damage-inducible protein DinB